MTDTFETPENATPLSHEERECLVPKWIATRAELNAAEGANIEDAMIWARRRRRRDMLDEAFVRLLHRKMFGDTWSWAGDYRRSARNLGVEPWRIPDELGALLADVRFWIERSVFPPDEIAVRAHHRLVAVHPFPNGNGRHARLFADLLIEQLGGRPFSWGAGRPDAPAEIRRAYIAALRKADAHDPGDLIAFARS